MITPVSATPLESLFAMHFVSPIAAVGNVPVNAAAAVAFSLKAIVCENPSTKL